MRLACGARAIDAAAPQHAKYSDLVAFVHVKKAIILVSSTGLFICLCVCLCSGLVCTQRNVAATATGQCIGPMLLPPQNMACNALYKAPKLTSFQALLKKAKLPKTAH